MQSRRLHISPLTGRTRKPRATLLVASAGCAVTVFEANVTAMVLPQIARHLEAPFDALAWVISAFLLSFCAMLLPAGVISDRQGRKRTFLLGTSAYLFASLIAGVAPSLTILIVARVMQGVSAAFLLAPALAIVGQTYSEKRDRDRAWATWGGIMGLAMMMSPIAGGALASLSHWRWAFLVNVPVCLCLLGATIVFVGESRSEIRREVHPLSVALFAAGIFAITFGIIRGQKIGWTATESLGALLGGLLILGVFALLQAKLRHPLVELRLFLEKRFAAGIIAMFAYACCAQVMASVVPQILQNGFALGPSSSAAAMLAFATSMLVFPQVGRAIASRFADRTVLALGLSAVGVGNLLAAVSASSGALMWFLAGLFVIGAGGGVLNGETQKVLLGGVQPDRVGMASGISTTTRFGGILLGFTGLSGIAASVTRSELADTRGGEQLAEAVITGSLARASGSVPVNSRSPLLSAGRDAYLDGFTISFLGAAGLSALAALLVIVLMRRRRV